MISWLLTLAVICLAPLQLVQGQLYMISGNPSEYAAYASSLLRVNDNGTVTSVADLVPGVGAPRGVKWIAVANDFRRAFLLAGSPAKSFVVVDLDKAAVAKRCDIPRLPGADLHLEAWLADVPGQGLTFERDVSEVGNGKNVVQRMILDPSVPCEKSFAIGDPSDARFIVAHGVAGVAGLVPYDGLFGMTDQAGKTRALLAGAYVAFDDDIPATLRTGFNAPTNTAVLINNQNMLVVGLGDGHDSKRTLVLRKKDKIWRALPSESERFSPIRGFGHYIAIAEAQARNERSPESSGRSEWRTSESAHGPSTEETMAEFSYVFPGRLHLYNIDNEHFYTIETKQGDSEIILVEGNTVYYRVSDRLYSAPITETEIGPARLIATDKAIRDAHWAFIKH